MKTITFIAGITMSLIFMTVSTVKAQAYLGKSYTPTEKIDVFLEIEDIAKPYEVMGKSTVAQGFKSLAKTQEKIVKLGQTKGADAVVMKLIEEVTGSQQNDFGTIKNGKKTTSTVIGSTSTTNIKVKKVEAIFIKYKEN